jgi:glutathione S-transferase
MKLYTHALSPFSAKVRIALAEKGVSFEEERLPITRTAIVRKPKELLDANPRGEVPTLFDGDLALHDSTVILEYLEERFPEPPLLPAGGAAQRARARLLEDDADWLMTTAIADLLAEAYRKTDPAARDASKIAAASEAIRRAYDRLESALADGREHLAGAFGVADVAWYLPVSFAAFFGVSPAGTHPRLAAWLARVAARPSIAAETGAMTEALRALPD